MTQFAADDFAYIAARQKQLAADAPDMDAANEPADFSTENMQIKCRERRPIECVMCFHKWSGFTADDCPSCKAKNPEIPF